MRTAWLCDFDGTISPADVGAALVERFAVADAGDALAHWARGEIGHRELTRAECGRMRVTEEEARGFARRFALDPGFAGFVAAARAGGDVVAVVSEGFDYYVADALARAGLGELPWAANHARFEQDRLVPEFPWKGGCGRCGNCKAQHVEHWRAKGCRVIAVGDGLSDRCAAVAADQVMARGSLLEWCRANGISASPFRDFAELARVVGPGGASPRAAGSVARP
jgi:2,3-diketo-5-methylthio-1-phosphopentane phosphatase